MRAVGSSWTDVERVQGWSGMPKCEMLGSQTHWFHGDWENWGTRTEVWSRIGQRAHKKMQKQGEKRQEML